MLPDNQKVLIAADHAGYELKQYLVEKLTEQGYILVDFGTNAPDSVDYPDYAHKVAQAVLHEEAGIAILVCGSGIGMSIVANRYKGIRAALCHSEELAYLARTHNHANILCLAARFTSPTDALQICNKFLATPYKTDNSIDNSKHARRVDKIDIEIIEKC